MSPVQGQGAHRRALGSPSTWVACMRQKLVLNTRNDGMKEKHPWQRHCLTVVVGDILLCVRGVWHLLQL